MNALTQLVGRILRQPETTYLPKEFAALNESYVFCHHAETKAVTDKIKKGLEEDGLDDLTGAVRDDNDSAVPPARCTLQRREKFRTLSVFLPLVNWVEPVGARPLDYEQDILYRIDWAKLDMQPLVERLINPSGPEKSWIARMELGEADTDDWITTSREAITEVQAFDTVYATRVMVDVVPNPWVARSLLGDLLKQLADNGLTPEKIDAMASYILEELRKHLLLERDRLAEEEFHASVSAERIQFRLRADRTLWKLPQELPTALPATARQLRRDSGDAIEASIFSPVYEADLNPDERKFACYLDEQAALQWWHRNVAKTGYGIQGWKKNRVYPDFIFGYQKSGNKKRIAVWETKGDQLAGNLDTEYKRKLLKAMSAAYKAEHVVHAGELALVGEDGESVECEMVLMSEWKPTLNKLL